MLRKSCFSQFFFFTLFIALAMPCVANTEVQTDFDLGTLTVEAPSWAHAEEITGRADGEMFFEIQPHTGKTTLSESLDGQMGINLRTNGGAGHIAAISSAGLSGNKILVIKDGLAVNDPFTGSPDIGDFSSLQFERAEFWKGNRATLWGSNSIGGTLRLTSRFPDDGKVRFWTDGHGGSGQAIETRFYPGEARIGVRLSQFKTPGFSAASSETNSERDAFELDNIYAALEKEFPQNLQLQMSAESSSSMTDLDGFDFVTGLPADNLYFRQKKLSNQFNLGLTRHLHNGSLRMAHVFNHSSMTGIDEGNPFNEYGLETSRQKQLISRSHKSKNSSLLAEISRTETRAENHGLFVNRETDHAMFLATQHQLARDFSANLTARHDNPQNHCGVTTGNLSLCRTTGATELLAAWGQAFRMPSLNERYYPAYGDPELTSEHSSSFGLTVSRRFSKIGKLTAGATRYLVRDLIGTTATLDPAYTWGIKAANLNRAQLVSHSLSISECKFAHCSFTGEFSLMDKFRLKNSGKEVPGIARRQANASLERQIDRTNWKLQCQWWGKTWEDAENTRNAGADHELSLFISKSFNKCSAELGFLNITNRQNSRVVGYTRPGKRLTLAFTASF